MRTPESITLLAWVQAVWERVLPVSHASGAIYGTLVTAGTIVGASEGAHDVVEVDVAVIVTLGLYWIAHSYAEVLGNADQVAPSWKIAARELGRESAMVGACVVPLAVLVAANLLGAGFELSVTIGLCVTVALLFAWGVVAARRADVGRAWAVTSGVLYTLIGVAIVVLQLVLAH